MAENPIAYALADLGRSVRTMSADEESRRRNQMAMQAQTGQQQLALESLKLQGQRQEAELGLQGAQQAASIRQGEAAQALQGRQVALQEAAQVETTRHTTWQEQQDIVKQNDVRALNQAHISYYTTLNNAASTADQIAKAKYQLEQTPINVHSLAEAVVGGPNADPKDKAMLIGALGQLQSTGHIDDTTTVPFGPAMAMAKSLIDLRAAAEKGDNDLTKTLVTTVVGKAIAAGRPIDEALEMANFVQRWGTDPAGTIQELHERKAAAETLRTQMATDEKIDYYKLTPQQKTAFDARVNAGVQRMMQYKKTGVDPYGAPPAPAPSPTGAPPPPGPQGTVLPSAGAVRQFANVPAPLQSKIVTAAQREAQRQGVPASDLYALMHVESGFDPAAVNDESGAAGLMQLIAGTAKRYEVTNPHDVDEGIRGGAMDWARALRVAKGDPAEAYRRYYNPGATQAEVSKFLAAREAFAAQPFAAREGVLSRLGQRVQGVLGAVRDVLNPAMPAAEGAERPKQTNPRTSEIEGSYKKEYDAVFPARAGLYDYYVQLREGGMPVSEATGETRKRWRQQEAGGAPPATVLHPR